MKCFQPEKISNRKVNCVESKNALDKVNLFHFFLHALTFLTCRHVLRMCFTQEDYWWWNAKTPFPVYLIIGCFVNDPPNYMQ